MSNLSEIDRLKSTLAEWVPGGDLPFGEILRRALQGLAVDRAELADMFETSPSTVSRWANGYSTPQPYLQRQVAAYLRKIAEAECAALASEAAQGRRVAEEVARWRDDDRLIAQDLLAQMRGAGERSPAEERVYQAVQALCTKLEDSSGMHADKLLALMAEAANDDVPAAPRGGAAARPRRLRRSRRRVARRV